MIPNFKAHPWHGISAGAEVSGVRFFPVVRGGNRFADYKNDYDREEETGPKGEGSCGRAGAFQAEAESEGKDPGGGGITGQGEDHRKDSGAFLQGHGVQGPSPGSAPEEAGRGY